MTLSKFQPAQINGCECYTSGVFIIVKNNNGKWNAYKNGTSIIKPVIRQDAGKNDKGVDVLIDVLGAKEYPTLEAAAVDCK